MAKKPKKIELNDDSNDFVGTNAAEKIFGNGGDDNISGGAGKDKIDGGEGNDTLKGGSGNDKLIGGAGDDIMLGGAGDDTITSGEGADIVDGGAGDDTLKLAVNIADVTITKNDDGSFELTTATGSVSVKNVEVFQFADKTFVAEDLPISTDGSVTLTEFADTVTGNIINAPRGFTPGGTDQVNTLNDDDVITGTGTNATLNFDFVNDADTGDTDIQATLNKIETINVDVRLDGSAQLDLQDEDGSVRNINLEGIDDDVSFFTVDNIQNIAAVATGINLSINDTNAENAEVNFLIDGDAVVGTADIVNLTLNDADVFEVEIDDADDASNSGVEQINLASTGAANAVAQLAIEDTESLTITGDKDLSLGNSAEASNNGLVEAIVYSGAFNQGGFNTAAGSLTKIDASALTGNLELNLGTEVIATKDGTSGVSVEIDVKTGAGNDTIRLTSGFDSAGDKVDAGTGDNTLVVYGSVTKGSITNVQHLDVDNRPTTTDPLTVDASLFTGLKDISVRNVGVNGANTIVASSSVVVLNKLTADLAKAITAEHSTTGSNGIGQNILAANLATDTAADIVAVTIKDNVNADPRFNLTLQTASVENITINDLDTESNSVLLGADPTGTNNKDATPTATEFVSDITGTITLTGGAAGQFLNLDATAANFYGFALDGSATDGSAAQQAFLGVGKNVFDVVGVDFTASKIDASTFAGDVVVRVSDAEDAKGTETATGGQTIMMGTGNDTVVFDDTDLADTHAGLTISDVVSGGAGNDTLALEGNAATNIVIGASEWTNVSGFETIRLTGTGGNGAADKFGDNDYNLLLTNELINKNGVAGKIAIVNDNDLSDEAGTLAPLFANQQMRGVTIDARGLDAAHTFSYNGAEGAGRESKDRFILTDATINGTALINGGFAVFNTNAANSDILEARNSSQVTIGDLANTSNIGTLQFTNDTATVQTSTLELNASIIDTLVNSSHTAKAGEVEVLTVQAFGSQTLPAASTVVNVNLTGLSAADYTKVGVTFSTVGAAAGTKAEINVIGGDAGGSVTFNGGAGDDTFVGGDGNDIINAGTGADTIRGGKGADDIELGGFDAQQDIVIIDVNTDLAAGTVSANADDVGGFLNAADRWSILDSSDNLLRSSGAVSSTVALTAGDDIGAGQFFSEAAVGTTALNAAALNGVVVYQATTAIAGSDFDTQGGIDAAVAAIVAGFAADVVTANADMFIIVQDADNDSAIFRYQEGAADAGIQASELTLVATAEDIFAGWNDTNFL